MARDKRGKSYNRRLPSLNMDFNPDDVYDVDCYVTEEEEEPRWRRRARNTGRFVDSAYSAGSRWGRGYVQGISPAMEEGSHAAIGTLGTVASHTNPLRPWRSFAFWSMGVGTLVVGGWVCQFFLGSVMAARNPQPLPQNAPVSMRFGHGVVTTGKPVASGVVSGVQEVGSGATNSLDRAVRLQLVDNDGWRQPSNVARRQSQQPVTTLPLTSWTGGTDYQSNQRK